MKIFILTTKHDATLETYKSFDELLKRVDFINQSFYDGETYGLYGAPFEIVDFDFDTGSSEIQDMPYIIDSAVLTKRDESGLRTVYHTFLMYAIDSETGLRTTLK